MSNPTRWSIEMMSLLMDKNPCATCFNNQTWELVPILIIFYKSMPYKNILRWLLRKNVVRLRFHLQTTSVVNADGFLVVSAYSLVVVSSKL